MLFVSHRLTRVYMFCYRIDTQYSLPEQLFNFQQVQDGSYTVSQDYNVDKECAKM